LGFSKEKSASGRKDKRFRWRGATIDEKSGATDIENLPLEKFYRCGSVLSPRNHHFRPGL